MSVKSHARRKSLAFMPVFNSDERVTGHFLHQDHVIGCQRIKALQVALENLSRSASSVSSTGLPHQIPMSLRSDSSSTDMTFAGTARAPLSMTCCLVARNHMTGHGPCSAMWLSIWERDYVLPGGAARSTVGNKGQRELCRHR